MKTAITVKLPSMMIFAGYHEEIAFKDNAKKILPNLKLKTIGWDAGWLITMAYVGTLKDSTNKAKAKQLLKSVDNVEV